MTGMGWNLKGLFFSLCRHGFLRVAYTRCGFKGDAHEQGGACADAAQSSTGGVCFCCGLSLFIEGEGIIVLRALHAGSMKPFSNFKAFCRRKRKHGFCEIGLEFFEKRVPQTYGKFRGFNRDDPSH